MPRKSFLDYFGEGLSELEKMMRPVTAPVRQFLEGIGLAEAKVQPDTAPQVVAQKPAAPPSTLDNGHGLPDQKKLDLMRLFGINHDGKGDPPPPPPPGASGAVAVAPAQDRKPSHS